MLPLLLLIAFISNFSYLYCFLVLVLSSHDAFSSFSDLNMLDESEGSQQLDFKEHSKGELLYFRNFTPNRVLLLLTTPQPSLDPLYN